jgi:hypothetical protein
VVVWLKIYCASVVLLLVIFYLYERAKVGPIAPRVILVMTEMAAFFALLPATAYVLFTEMLRRGR